MGVDSHSRSIPRIRRMSGEIRETLETRSTLVFYRRSNCRTYFLRRVLRYLSEEKKNDLVLILIFNFTIMLFQYESIVFPFLKNFSLQFKKKIRIKPVSPSGSSTHPP